MEILGSSIKKFQEMETPKKIIYISGNGNSKKDSYISGNETFQSTQKKVLFQEMETLRKLFIFSQKKAFLIFQEAETLKQNVLIFQDELKRPQKPNFIIFSQKRLLINFSKNTFT